MGIPSVSLLACFLLALPAPHPLSGLQNVQEDSLDKLVERWTADTIALRDQVSQEVLRRWKTWSERDLATLESLSKRDDKDLANRAKVILGRIRMRRRIGEALVLKMSNLDRALQSKDERNILQAAQDAGTLCLRGHLKDEELEGLVKVLCAHTWSSGVTRFLAWVEKTNLTAFSQLTKDLSRSPVSDIRIAALNALGSLRAPESAKLISGHLSNDDPETRSAAIYALAKLRERESLKDILPLLEDPELDVKSAAILAVGLLGSKEHPAKVTPFLKSEQPELREAAVDALARLGDESALNSVAALIEDRNIDVQIGAIQAVGRLRSKEHLHLIVPLLREEDFSLAQIATAVLSRTAGKESLPQLTQLLRDSNPAVVARAIRVLSAIGTRTDLDSIMPLIDHRNGFVRTECIRAIGTLGSQTDARKLGERLQRAEPSEFEEIASVLCRRTVPDFLDTLLRRSKEPLLRDVLLDLGELSFQLENEKQTSRIAAKLKEIRSNAKSGHVIATIALIGLGNEDVTKQLEMIGTFSVGGREAWHPYGPRLCNALSQTHAKKEWRLFTKRFRLDSSLNSFEDFQSLAKSQGLQIVGSERVDLWGSANPGRETSLRELLDGLLWGRAAYVLESGTIVVLRPQEALNFWRRKVLSVK